MAQETDAKIKRISVEILDDGSFLYEVCPEHEHDEKGGAQLHEPQRQAVEDLDKLLSLIEDDLGSAHVRKPPLGSGERFKQLTAKLEAKGAKSPSALAAWIGRRKYGKGKFQKLAAKGKRGGVWK